VKSEYPNATRRESVIDKQAYDAAIVLIARVGLAELALTRRLQEQWIVGETAIEVAALLRVLALHRHDSVGSRAPLQNRRDERIPREGEISETVAFIV
jgi:hypothetical protein